MGAPPPQHRMYDFPYPSKHSIILTHRIMHFTHSRHDSFTHGEQPLPPLHTCLGSRLYTHTHTCTRAHACNTTNFIRFYVYPKLHHMLPYTHTHTNTGSASRPSGCAENSPLRGRASTRSLKLKIDFRCNTNDTHTHTYIFTSTCTDLRRRGEGGRW